MKIQKFQKTNGKNIKAQLSLELLFGLSIIFILFSICIHLINQKNDEIFYHQGLMEEIGSCSVLADSISSVIASGPQSKHSLKIYHNLTVSGSSALITTENTQCTLPAKNIISASGTGFFSLNAGLVTVENIDSMIMVQNT